MRPVPAPQPRCANGECPRPSEPGERYCATCGLERSLFDPETRREAVRRQAGARGESGRR